MRSFLSLKPLWLVSNWARGAVRDLPQHVFGRSPNSLL